MNAVGVIPALFALVVVAVMAYRAGYLRGQAELLSQHQSTEAPRHGLRMTAILPQWSRVTGWAAYVGSGLLLGLFVFLAFRHAKGWGWIGLLGAWALWFALFM